MVVSLVGDGGFGQNPAVLATAFEQDIAVVWVVMNNYAFGTIAGLREGALRHDVRHACSRRTASRTRPTSPRSRGPTASTACKIESAAEFKPALRAGDRSRQARSCIDVAMVNEPVPTAGHWNIMDIYSPGKKKSHVTT